MLQAQLAVKGSGVVLSHPRVPVLKGMVSREEEISKSNTHTLQEEYRVKRERTQSHEDPYHRDYAVLEVTP